MSEQKEVGPIYGVELIRDLPIGGMLQAMPTRSDLDQVRRISERTVAGYEVLLRHYLDLKAKHDKNPPDITTMGTQLVSMDGSSKLIRN